MLGWLSKINIRCYLLFLFYESSKKSLTVLLYWWTISVFHSLHSGCKPGMVCHLNEWPSTHLLIFITYRIRTILFFNLFFRFNGPLEHPDFEIDLYCTGGQWIVPYIDQMELFVFSTKKLNLTLVHRDGDVNESRAQMVLKDIKCIVENTVSGQK